jgi:hypothetical protein
MILLVSADSMLSQISYRISHSISDPSKAAESLTVSGNSCRGLTRAPPQLLPIDSSTTAQLQFSISHPKLNFE